MISLSNVNAVTARKVQLDSMLNSHSSSYDFHSFSVRSEYGRKLKSSSDMELKSYFGLSYIKFSLPIVLSRMEVLFRNLVAKKKI